MSTLHLVVSNPPRSTVRCSSNLAGGFYYAVPGKIVACDKSGK